MSALIEKWEHLDANSDIPAEDILIQADALGIIKMPKNWNTPDDDITAAEIDFHAHGPKKKAKPRKKK